MKTLDQIRDLNAAGRADEFFLARLAQFIPEDQLAGFGLQLEEEYMGGHVHMEYTRQAVLNQLEREVEAGFEKALAKRGPSSFISFRAVLLWNWVLEDGLQNWPMADYAVFGLPLFKATAEKYGFDNPIGDDTGAESHYDISF